MRRDPPPPPQIQNATPKKLRKIGAAAEPIEKTPAHWTIAAVTPPWIATNAALFRHAFLTAFSPLPPRHATIFRTYAASFRHFFSLLLMKHPHETLPAAGPGGAVEIEICSWKKITKNRVSTTEKCEISSTFGSKNVNHTQTLNQTIISDSKSKSPTLCGDGCAGCGVVAEKNHLFSHESL